MYIYIVQAPFSVSSLLVLSWNLAPRPKTTVTTSYIQCLDLGKYIFSFVFPPDCICISISSRSYLYCAREPINIILCWQVVAIKKRKSPQFTISSLLVNNIIDIFVRLWIGCLSNEEIRRSMADMAGKYIHEASFNNIIVMTSLCVDISGLLTKQFASLCTLYIWNCAAHQ